MESETRVGDVGQRAGAGRWVSAGLLPAADLFYEVVKEKEDEAQRHCKERCMLLCTGALPLSALSERLNVEGHDVTVQRRSCTATSAPR